MPPHTRAAGVREASREESAGQVRSVAPRTMGKVALAVVSWSARTIECEGREALASADKHAWRRIRPLRAWWKCRRCRAPIRHQCECPCRSKIGRTCEKYSSLVLA